MRCRSEVLRRRLQVLDDNDEEEDCYIDYIAFCKFCSTSELVIMAQVRRDSRYSTNWVEKGR